MTKDLNGFRSNCAVRISGGDYSAGGADCEDVTRAPRATATPEVLAESNIRLPS